jgi:flagellar hook-length control protein FliK
MAEAVAMPRLISEIKSSLKLQSTQAALSPNPGSAGKAAESADSETAANADSQALGSFAEIGQDPASGEVGFWESDPEAGIAASPESLPTPAAGAVNRIAAQTATGRYTRVAPDERGNAPQAGLVTVGGAFQAARVQSAQEAAHAPGEIVFSPLSESDPSAGKPQSAAKSRLTAARPATGPSASEPGSAAPQEIRSQRSASPDRAEAPVRPSAAQPAFEPDASGQLVRSAIHALSRGETRYHLKLHPEDLGEVAVTISARDRELHLTIHASSEATRNLIASQADGLRSGLADSGYRLGGFNVDVSANGQGGEAFSQFQQGAGRQPSGRQPDARAEGGPADRHPAHVLLERVLEARAGAINLRI